jgi:hypothetical protein
MKAYILLYCLSGLGDQYSNISTGYKAYTDLKKLGYEVEVYWLNNNIYYSSDYPLDHIFDFDLFYKDGVKISYIRNESELSNKYILLPSNQNAIKIFLTKIIDELNDYTLPVYDYYGFHRNAYTSYNPDMLPTFNYQFLSKYVLDIGNKFVSKSQIKAVHFRSADYHNRVHYSEVFKDEFFKERTDFACQFIEENKNEDIMICSSSKSIRDFFIKNFNNTFYNEFDTELELHNSYNKNFDESTNIHHTQQIAAEMFLFSKCDKIFTVGKSLSNFLTYGVNHNIHHNNWETKIKNLIIN